MKSLTKVLMTGMVMISVLAGCQTLENKPLNEPDITGTDVI